MDKLDNNDKLENQFIKLMIGYKYFINIIFWLGF